MENTDTINDIVNDALGSVEADANDVEKAAADAELDRKINEAAAELSADQETLKVVDEVEDAVADVADKVDDVKGAVSEAIATVAKSEESEAAKEVTLETLINDYNDSILKIGSLEEQNAKLLEENAKLNADNKLALARLAQGFREAQAVPVSALESESDKLDDVVDSTVKEILDQI